MITIRSLSLSSVLFAMVLQMMLVSYSNAFSIVPSSSVPVRITTTSTTSSSTQLQIFGDALKGAFANDDSLGAVKNAGLKNVRHNIYIYIISIIILIMFCYVLT